MVKDKSPRQSKAQTKKRASAKKGSEVASPVPERVPQIGPNTPYQVCSERLTAFGGLLALVKFLDLIGFEALFAQHYTAPKRQPELGHHAMIVGILMLLFIGFQRLGHLAYVQMDPMLCGILRVAALPVVSTFWRYLKSLGINQSGSLLRLGASVRQKVWDLCDLNYPEVSIHIDTTVSTVYGQIEGSRKGHNTKTSGQEGAAPGVVLYGGDTGVSVWHATAWGNDLWRGSRAADSAVSAAAAPLRLSGARAGGRGIHQLGEHPGL